MAHVAVIYNLERDDQSLVSALTEIILMAVMCAKVSGLKSSVAFDLTCWVGYKDMCYFAWS